jgi:(S)-ureidoglycine aminohydrolase
MISFYYWRKTLPRALKKNGNHVNQSVKTSFMNELFGFTRTVVKSRYALLAPDGFVPGNLPGWKNATVIINISPAMGAQFSQYQITLGPNSRGEGDTGPFEHFVYVLAGKCSADIGGKKINLSAGGYVFIPPSTDFYFREATNGTRLLVFQKKYEPLAGTQKPEILHGHEKNVPGRPFLGNKDARLQVLLPDTMAFDLAVNIFTYQPGATLPFVEAHIMEHGLLMLKGQGVYRLGSDWHPVKEGDVIWMAPYCPQWFVAMGKGPASYIYYKNVNRAPLSA